MATEKNSTGKIIKSIYYDRILFFSDLDGTLLNSNSDVSKFTCKIVKRLLDAGHVFCIITGRPPKDALHIYKKLHLKHLMCNLDGAYIWNPSDKSFSPINWCFNSRTALKILTNKKIMRYVDNFCVENYKGVFLRYRPKVMVHDGQFNTFGIKPDQKINLCSKNLSNIKGVDCHAILLQVKDGNKDNLDQLLFELHFVSKTLLTRVWNEPEVGYVVEVICKFASKETALDYLSDYYSIPKEMCFAFGDGTNDEGMLRKASYGYAMMNACPTAKSAASFITKYTNNEDGVARTIEYLGKKVYRVIKRQRDKVIAEYKKQHRTSSKKTKKR